MTSEKINSKSRDNYLDFLRGIASISVVFIHTAYHSGDWYVPEKVRTIALLLDVPFFMFLSGWSTFYSVNIKRMLKTFLNTWLLWAVIISSMDIVFMIAGLWGGNDVGRIWLQQLLFISCDLPNMTSFNWSIWYMPVFFRVTSIGTIFIWFSRKIGWKDSDYIFVLIFLIIGDVYLTVSEQGKTFFLLSQETCFFLFFFVLGFYIKSINFQFRNIKNWIGTITSLICIWLISSRVLNINMGALQSSKFPPNIMYLTASLISVVCALYFRTRISDKMLEKVKSIQYIGKNSICFYFSQGFGGASLFYVAFRLDMIWQQKIIICFLINLVVTICIGITFSIINKFLKNLIKWICGHVLCEI